MSDRFMTVAKAGEIPEGGLKVVRVDDEPVVVFHVGGQYYALADRCSHARQPLHGGRLRGYEITCPLHGARFDIRTGQCLAAPASAPVQTFPVSIESGKVSVSVAGAVAPPRPRFGPMN